MGPVGGSGCAVAEVVAGDGCATVAWCGPGDGDLFGAGSGGGAAMAVTVAVAWRRQVAAEAMLAAAASMVVAE